MEIVTLLLKFIGVSAILTILYYIIYAKTAPFFQCRIYLSAILLISATVSLSEIKIYPAAIRTVEVQEEANEAIAFTNEYYNENETVQPNETVTVSTEATQTPFTVNDWLLAVYIAVTAMLLLRYFYQLYKIFTITRWGSVSINKNYKLVRNNKVSSPFSYFRSIYINRKLGDETLDVVLQHELCHIKHRHYIDTTVMEFLSIFLWFNPLTWVIKHELRDIHEFQVDSSMIRNGLDIPKYQNILFAELMGYSPNIANGLHNSLIKKRFIMMTRDRVIKHGLVRKLLVLPIILSLFVLFSFTEKDDVIRYISIPTTDILTNNEPTIIAEKVVTEPKQEPEKQPESPMTVTPAATKDTVIIETVVTKTIKNDNDSILQKTVTKKETQFIELNKNQIVISNKKTNRPIVEYIEPMEDKTLVTIVVPINENEYYIKFLPDFGIRNPKTGERYPLVTVMKNIPLNKIITINGMKGKCIEFTMVFPPLKENVSFIEICYGSGRYFPETPIPFEEKHDINGKQILIRTTTLPSFRDLDIEKYKKIDYNYYYMTAEQTPTVLLVNGRQDGKLLSVVRTETETLVTFATRIYYDSQWISFDSGMVLRNCKTNEKYYIKRVEKDIPLNRVCVVKGKKNEFVMYTMVFPRLPNDVDKIDIISTPHVNKVPTPQPGSPLNWYGISVKNNKFDSDNKNTFRKRNTTHPAARMETTIESKGKPEMLLRIQNNSVTSLIITLDKSEVINIPSDFAIRDVASGKLYRARSVHPYNFDIAVGGQKGDRIVLTFANLTYGVDKIDIGVFTKNGEVEHPWSYKNIEINN